MKPFLYLYTNTNRKVTGIGVEHLFRRHKNGRYSYLCSRFGGNQSWRPHLHQKQKDTFLFGDILSICSGSRWRYEEVDNEWVYRQTFTDLL